MNRQTVTTPAGKAFYPRVVTPDTKFNVDGVYSCRLHVSEEDYEAFKAQLAPMVEQEYNKYCIAKGKDKLKRAIEPIRITDDGDFEISAKQPAKIRTKEGETIEMKIALYDADVQPMTGDVTIGSGSKLRMSVQPYCWYVPSTGFGYTLKLKAVQVLELVEYDSSGHGFSKESGFTQGESFEEVLVEDDTPATEDF